MALLEAKDETGPICPRLDPTHPRMRGWERGVWDDRGRRRVAGAVAEQRLSGLQREAAHGEA